MSSNVAYIDELDDLDTNLESHLSGDNLDVNLLLGDTAHTRTYLISLQDDLDQVQARVDKIVGKLYQIQDGIKKGVELAEDNSGSTSGESTNAFVTAIAKHVAKGGDRLNLDSELCFGI